MNKIRRRIIIYAKDIETITGRKRRTVYAIMQKIKSHYNKDESSLITITEFCAFMQIEEAVVRDFLVD